MADHVYYITEIRVTKVTKKDIRDATGTRADRQTALIGHITVPAEDIESAKALSVQHINLLQDGYEIDIPRTR